MLPSRVHAAAIAGVLAAAVGWGVAGPGRAPTGHAGPAGPAGSVALSEARPAVAVTAAASGSRRAVGAPQARRTSAVASRSSHRTPVRRPPAHRVAHHRHRITAAEQARRVLRVARNLRGRPYRWGAAGPHAFDCSGYVQFVYRRALGRRLPKYTDTQYAVLHHISRRALRPGDLVFVGGRRHHKSHVGIYAGQGLWWDAPHTGSHVRKQPVWGRSHAYARVVLPAH